MSYTLNTNHEEWEIVGIGNSYEIISIGQRDFSIIPISADCDERHIWHVVYREKGKYAFTYSVELKDDGTDPNDNVRIVPKFKLSEGMDVSTIEIQPNGSYKLLSVKAIKVNKDCFNVSYYDLEMKCDYETLFDQYGYCMVEGSENWRIVPKQKVQEYPDLNPNEWKWHNVDENRPVINIENLHDGTYKAWLSLHVFYHVNAEGNSTISGQPIIRRKKEVKQEYSDTNANEELDSVFGKLDREYNAPSKERSPALSLLLSTLANLTDTVLKVEAQAFAEYVKTTKGTDIQTDYYNFRRLK